MEGTGILISVDRGRGKGNVEQGARLCIDGLSGVCNDTCRLMGNWSEIYGTWKIEDSAEKWGLFSALAGVDQCADPVELTQILKNLVYMFFLSPLFLPANLLVSKVNTSIS